MRCPLTRERKQTNFQFEKFSRPPTRLSARESVNTEEYKESVNTEFNREIKMGIEKMSISRTFRLRERPIAGS